MSNPISIEELNASFNVEKYRQDSERQKELGRTMLKVGAMVMVIDSSDRMLVLHHAAKDGVWKEGAAGPSMETARYIKRSSGDNGPLTESPMQAWQRSLDEELGMDVSDISDAKFYIPKNFIAVRNDWNFGRTKDHEHAFYAGVSLVLGVENPQVIFDAFSKAGSQTEEVIDIEFMYPQKALGLENTRPGFGDWLEGMQALRGENPVLAEPAIYIEPVQHPSRYDGDIRFAD